MKSTPGTTLAKKPGMSRVKLARRVRPTGPLVRFKVAYHQIADIFLLVFWYVIMLSVLSVKQIC